MAAGDAAAVAYSEGLSVESPSEAELLESALSLEPVLPLESAVAVAMGAVSAALNPAGVVGSDGPTIAASNRRSSNASKRHLRWGIFVSSRLGIRATSTTKYPLRLVCCVLIRNGPAMVVGKELKKFRLRARFRPPATFIPVVKSS